jgi:hypothetical protein
MGFCSSVCEPKSFIIAWPFIFCVKYFYVLNILISLRFNYFPENLKCLIGTLEGLPSGQ